MDFPCGQHLQPKTVHSGNLQFCTLSCPVPKRSACVYVFMYAVVINAENSKQVEDNLIKHVHHQCWPLHGYRLMSLCAVTFAGVCAMWGSRGHWESVTSPFVKPCQEFLFCFPHPFPAWIPSHFLCCSIQERAKPFVRDTDSHTHRHGADIHKTAFGQSQTQTHTTDRQTVMEDIGRETVLSQACSWQDSAPRGRTFTSFVL